ncbi:MAG: lipase maturation factor family protein, partial [Chthoniobacterales bacterium]
DLRKPQFAISAWIFLRLLGATFLIAFASLWKQLPGLIGHEGILPFGLFFKAVSSQLHGAGYGFFPSLLWLHPTDQFLMALLGVGILCSLALIFTFAQRWALFGCWIIYLSIISAGQIFMSFQWDVLLLEAGFLSLFFVPRGWWQGTQMVNPPRGARFLLIWLLFRLMFASGLVKLSSGDVTWSSLAALHFHYFTQPLPNPISWYVQQLPAVCQKISVVVMFVIELGAPFLIFGGRRLRLLAFFSLVGLQLMISLTGNYGFFNLLSIALCILLVDDRRLSSWLRIKKEAVKQTYSAFLKWCAIAAGCILFLLSLLPFSTAFRVRMPFPDAAISFYQWTLPFHLANSYGLFAVMTTERNEITIEGSNDRINWKPYVFPFKPGPLNRPPPFAFFYMPRLDWQMWFAALSSEQENPWVRHFLIQLLHNSPPVVALLEKNPFAEKPPKYLRAQVGSYRFTNYEERAATGDWWKESPEGIYLPPVKLTR